MNMNKIVYLIFVITGCITNEKSNFNFDVYRVHAPIDYSQVEIKIVNSILTVKDDTFIFSGKVVDLNKDIPLQHVKIFVFNEFIEEEIDTTNLNGDFKFKIYKNKYSNAKLGFASIYTREYHYNLEKIIKSYE